MWDERSPDERIKGHASLLSPSHRRSTILTDVSIGMVGLSNAASCHAKHEGMELMKGYDLIGLYHDADDPRIIVPKRVKALGWTINVGHRRGRMVLAAVILVIFVAAAIEYR